MSISGNQIKIKIKKKHNFLKKKKFNHYKLTNNQLIFFKKNGFIIIKDVLNSIDTQDFKKEIWNTIYKIPFSQDVKNKIDFDFRDYDKNLTEEEIKNINIFYPNIDKFGTMNLPPFFHLHNMWKARQNPKIFIKFAQLLNNHKIWCSLDRVSVKLPGKGNSEFCHWDSDPWYWEEQQFEPLQGLLSLCDTSFFCCPGSHSLDFGKKFKHFYQYLKPTKGRRE